MPFRVENLMADILPVLMLDRFTFEMPTFSARRFRDIFLSAITLSSLRIIAMVASEGLVRLLLQDPAVAEGEREAVDHDPRHHRSEEHEHGGGYATAGDPVGYG